MSNTTINTGTYLLSLLQDKYNHNQLLADSYKAMVNDYRKLQNEDNDYSKKIDELTETRNYHEAIATEIFTVVNKLGLMDKEVDYLSNLLGNYRVYKAKEESRN